MRGTVLKFDDVKGFGFIRPADGDGQREIFVHWQQVESRPGERRITLLVGEAVEYELGQDERGRYRAEKVIRLQ